MDSVFDLDQKEMVEDSVSSYSSLSEEVANARLDKKN